MSATAPRGSFVWHDLMTTDPDAAKAFYTEIVGWGTDIWEGAAAPYTMWTNNGVPLGGVMDLPKEAAAAGSPPHWLPYVASPDIQATADKAVELGGKIMVPPTEIPTVGKFTVITDPQGAVFAAFTASGDWPGNDDEPKVGEFSWHELATTDHEAALAFYSAVFGWEKKDAMDMGEAGTYQMYGRTEQTLGGIYNKSADIPGPPAWLMYSKVEDVNALVERISKLGGQILNGPMEVPGGSGDMIAQCMDPQGAAFAIHSSAASG